MQEDKNSIGPSTKYPKKEILKDTRLTCKNFSRSQSYIWQERRTSKTFGALMVTIVSNLLHLINLWAAR